MKKLFELLDSFVSIISNIVVMIVALGGITISVAQSDWFFGILFFICFCVNVYFCAMYYRKDLYIKFIEFLMSKSTHRFTLLPKLRVHMEAQKRINKIYVKNFDVKYEIERNNDYEKELIADLFITHSMTIKNKKLPKQYFILFGNDYAKDLPEIRYKFNSNRFSEPLEINIPQNFAAYERGKVGEIIISLQHENLPKDEVNLTVTYKYINSFNFSVTPTDTLIFLPKLYATEIDNVNYEVELKGFDNISEFNMNAYKIYNKKNFGIEFTSDDITNTIDSDNFNKKIKLHEIKNECAFYFKISIDKTIRTT